MTTVLVPSPPTSLRRHSHIRNVSAPANLHAPSPSSLNSSHHLGMSTSTPLATPSSSSGPTIVLLANSFNADVRRAGLDLVQRAGAKNRRHSAQQPPRPYKLGELERIQVRSTIAQIHLLVCGASGSVSGEEAENRSIIMHKLREAGASVVLHHVPLGTNRLSISVSKPSPKAALLRALQGESIAHVLEKGFSSAALVVSDGVEAKEELVKGFMEEMAFRLARRSTATATSPPNLAIYLPQHAHLGEFDLDLPSEQVYAVRIANLAAERFEESLGHPNPTRRRLPSSSPPSSTTTFVKSHAPTASLPHAKPLFLRPAPGPGAQSITMRLSLDTSDVVLRVAEAQTPIEKPTTPAFPLRTNRAPRSPFLSSSSSSIRSESSSSTLTPPSSPPRPTLKLAIPPPPPCATRSNTLTSTFSSPSPSSVTSAVNLASHSPILKLQVKRKDSQGDCLESAISAEEAPVWSEVRALLQSRFSNSALSRSGTMNRGVMV